MSEVSRTGKILAVSGGVLIFICMIAAIISYKYDKRILFAIFCWIMLGGLLMIYFGITMKKK